MSKKVGNQLSSELLVFENKLIYIIIKKLINIWDFPEVCYNISSIQNLDMLCEH